MAGQGIMVAIAVGEDPTIRTAARREMKPNRPMAVTQRTARATGCWNSILTAMGFFAVHRITTLENAPTRSCRAR